MSANETLKNMAYQRSMRYLLADSECMEMVSRKNQAEKKLRESLTPQQLELFDHLLDVDDELDGLILTKAYIAGLGDRSDMKQLRSISG